MNAVVNLFKNLTTNRVAELAEKVRDSGGVGGLAIIRNKDSAGNFSVSWAADGVTPVEALAMLDIMRSKLINQLTQNVGDPL